MAPYAGSSFASQPYAGGYESTPPPASWPNTPPLYATQPPTAPPEHLAIPDSAFSNQQPDAAPCRCLNCTPPAKPPSTSGGVVRGNSPVTADGKQPKPAPVPRGVRDSDESWSGLLAHYKLRGSAVSFVSLSWNEMWSLTEFVYAPVAQRTVTKYVSPNAMMLSGYQLADIFVAQLPFNMPLVALQAVVNAIGMPHVEILHASPHVKKGRSYDGCCFVKVLAEHGDNLVYRLNKTVLFDFNGLWIAQTPEAMVDLQKYCAYMLSIGSEERRHVLKRPIPFSAITCERAKRSYTF